MSSILDALRKIEAATQPPAALPPAAARGRRWTAHLMAGAVVLAFGTGAGLALWIGSRAALAPAPVKPVETAAVEVAPAPPMATPETVPPPEAVPTPPAAPALEPPAVVETPARVETAPAPVEGAPVPAGTLPVAAPTPPPAPTELEADAPRGRVATPPPPAGPAVASRAEPPPGAAEPTRPEAAAPEVEEPAPPVQEPSLLPRLPASAPHVEVNVLLYSRFPERRTVSLTIGGSGMVTLREGETSGDIEVTRILPERIHVRYAGQLFAVDARE